MPLHERPAVIYSLGALLLGGQFMSIGFLAELITAYQVRDADTYSIAERTRRARGKDHDAPHERRRRLLGRSSAGASTWLLIAVGHRRHAGPDPGGQLGRPDGARRPAASRGPQRLAAAAAVS